MSENKYTLAGWLAIAQAILFPVAIVVSILQGILGATIFHARLPTTFGPADFLFMINIALYVYTNIMFRRLLNERYSFHGVDMLITINIFLAIIIQLGSLFFKVALVALAPTLLGRPATFFTVGFMLLSLVTSGVIIILIAIQLLRAKEQFAEMIKALAVVLLIEGCCMITVILAPVQWLLLPVARIMLATVFLREQEEVEFV